MSEFILGSDSNPGGRKYNEDRCAVQQVKTASGLELSVAVLCDGVGGESRGERAAQLAIDTFMTHLNRGDSDDTLKLLVNAVKEANFAVFTEARRLGAEGRMACTLVAAVAQPDSTFYIANAGDSRIYLCREGKLVQLSRDHSFENVMVWLGKLSPEAAKANPEANKVMRVLGIKETIQVDVGNYTTTTDYGEANRLGKMGQKLETGDTILLCSDGLVKQTPETHQTLITEAEIVHILETREGDKAAQALMSAALGRIPVGEQVDNITTVVLQTPDPRRAANLATLQRERAQRQQRETRRKVVMAGVLVAVPLGVLLIMSLAAFAGFFAIVNKNNASTATWLAENTSVALAQTGTVAAYTATPTQTPTPKPTSTPIPTRVPTAVVGEIAKLFSGDEPVGVITDAQRELITAPEGETRYLAVTFLRYTAADPNKGSDGNIYLNESTRLQFGLVTRNQFQITLLPGSDVVVQTGPYARGAEIHLADSPVVVTGLGCLALHFVDDRTANVSCYDGECKYSTQIGAQLASLEQGSVLTLTLGTLSKTEIGQVSAADKARYWTLLTQTSAGRADADRCQLPDVGATQVAVAALAATAAALTKVAAVTDTPLPLPSATPQSSSNQPPPPPPPPTNTPVPPPSSTPVPPPSNTPVPPPSNTPLPTDTSAPPTDTSPPPTDTSPPPTDTSPPPTDTTPPPSEKAPG